MLREKELGTGETPKVIWELRIRQELRIRHESEDEGWTTCYTDGSGNRQEPIRVTNFIPLMLLVALLVLLPI